MVFKNKYGSFDSDDLLRRLREDRLTLSQLGSCYGLKKFQIVHVLRSMGITYRNKLGDVRVKNATITPDLHQMFLGTLLGDAYLVNYKNAGYRVGHSAYHQIDYTFHIAHMLRDFLSGISIRDVTYQKGKSKAVEVWSHHHEALNYYYHLFYPEGKRSIPQEALLQLDDRGLAYWYMDDGKLTDYGCILCVGDVSESELSMMEGALMSRFGIRSHRQYRDEEHGIWDLAILAESRARFLDRVRPFVIPSMNYKLGLSSIPMVSVPEKDFEDRKKFPKLWYTYRRFTDDYERFVLSSSSSDSDVAKTLGVSRVTVAQHREKMAIPVKRQREKIPRVLSQPFYQKDLVRVSEQEREEILDSLTEYYWGVGFPYPSFPEDVLKREFELLRSRVGATSAGTRVCNHFVRSRYAASRFDRPNPIRKFWGSKEALRVFMENRLQHFDGRLSDTSIRTGISLQGLPANFNPGLAKFLYEKYGGNDCRALDFSSGYGGRLLGFLANGKGSYQGVDPNQTAIAELNRMADMVCPWAGISRDRVSLICAPFEDLNISGEFDIVLSSPPYFKLESYSDDTNQSTYRFSTYAEWLERFWHTTLLKSLNVLRTGGHLIFSISNYRGFDLVGDTEKLLSGVELVDQHSVHLHNVFKNMDKSEKVFIYRK